MALRKLSYSQLTLGNSGILLSLAYSANSLFKMIVKDWKCSPVVNHVINLQKAQGLIPSPTLESGLSKFHITKYLLLNTLRLYEHPVSHNTQEVIHICACLLFTHQSKMNLYPIEI